MDRGRTKGTLQRQNRVNTVDHELAALGQNIRRARRTLNISQEELAFRCGLHRTYLSGVERGARNLSFASLLAIARGLELTVSELTRDTGCPLRPPGQPGSLVCK
jgi:transcriptional regulator with XRE-family HTH domain